MQSPNSPSVPSSEEVFDLVDAHDQVIGRERRSVVHREGLRHRAVHILLRNAKGEVFLQRRSPQKDMNPNCWDSSCSGHLDRGEDYLPAALRELGEELGVRLAAGDLEPLFKIEACAETGQEFVWVYCSLHEGPFVLQPEEISDGRFWAPLEIDQAVQAQEREFSSAFRFLWRKARDRF